MGLIEQENEQLRNRVRLLEETCDHLRIELAAKQERNDDLAAHVSRWRTQTNLARNKLDSAKVGRGRGIVINRKKRTQ